MLTQARDEDEHRHNARHNNEPPNLHRGRAEGERSRRGKGRWGWCGALGFSTFTDTHTQHPHRAKKLPPATPAGRALHRCC